MNAPLRSAPALIREPPLGADALERPTPEAVRAVWADTLKQPVPGYSDAALRRAFRQ